jgi:hypothetical protein
LVPLDPFATEGGGQVAFAAAGQTKAQQVVATAHQFSRTKHFTYSQTSV